MDFIVSSIFNKFSPLSVFSVSSLPIISISYHAIKILIKIITRIEIRSLIFENFIRNIDL